MCLSTKKSQSLWFSDSQSHRADPLILWRKVPHRSAQMGTCEYLHTCPLPSVSFSTSSIHTATKHIHFQLNYVLWTAWPLQHPPLTRGYWTCLFGYIIWVNYYPVWMYPVKILCVIFLHHGYGVIVYPVGQRHWY